MSRVVIDVDERFKVETSTLVLVSFTQEMTRDDNRRLCYFTLNEDWCW